MMARRDQAEQPELAPARAHSGLLTFLSDKAIQHSGPFAVWLAEWPVAAAAHWQWGGSSVASAFLTLSAVGITATTWWAGAEHGLKRQRLVMSVATAAAASGWFAGAAIGGPTTELAVNSWLMGGPTIAFAWAVKRALRTTENKQATGDGTEKGLFEKIGLARARAGQIKASPNKVTVPVTLDRGQQTHDDAAKASKGLAGVLGVPENAVRWEKDPEDAGRGQYVIVPEDMLKTPTPWPGPSCPGGSIADAPIPVGIYEDGPVCAIWFNGDEAAGRNAQHYQVMGMTGAGKTKLTIREIQHTIKDGDKHICGVHFHQKAIDRRQRFTRVEGSVSLGAHQTMAQRHEQRRWGPFIRDVAHHDPEPVLIQENKIVEIASHRTGRDH